jgi:1-acyl-sn-glycerol-3-phosphate acyltransferase
VLPSRPVRRVTGLLLIGALIVAVVLLPVLVVASVVASVFLPGRWRALRLLAFALVYAALQMVGQVAAAVLWVRSGFGRRLHTPSARAAHYTVLRLLLDVLMRVARRLFALRLVTDGESWSPLDDGVPGSTNAMVVLSRHAGPGDSLLLVHTLMDRDHLRRPRIVLKDLLQLDPLIDVYLNRLPNHFVAAGPGAGDRSAEAIADLAGDLGEEDALLIFPEGANFTPTRRLRAIERLRDRGLLHAVRRAEAMQHVLPPRPAGVSAALRAAPHADVVFVAHTGLEHLDTVRDVWRSLPMDKTLHLRWWFVPATDVPRDETDQQEWLYHWWETIDAWVDTTRRGEVGGADGSRHGAWARLSARRVPARPSRRLRPGSADFRS